MHIDVARAERARRAVSLGETVDVISLEHLLELERREAAQREAALQEKCDDYKSALRDGRCLINDLTSDKFKAIYAHGRALRELLNDNAPDEGDSEVIDQAITLADNIGMGVEDVENFVANVLDAISYSD